MAAKGMRTVALRNISANKLRMVLSVLAVVLGTAFISGSFTFTSTLQNTFDKILYGSSRGIDVMVKPAEDNLAGVPIADGDKILAIPGVRAIEEQTESPVVLIGKDGKPHQTGGAPTMGVAWVDPDRAVTPPNELVAGRAATGAGDVMMQQSVADKLGFHLGDPVTVYVPSKGPVPLTLVGEYENDLAVGGYVGLSFSPQQARELFTDGQHVPGIAVAGDGSRSQEELAADVAAVGPGLDVETGDAYLAEQADQLKQGFQFLNYFFVAFGLIALLVGTFIIFNTFSMLVAQRMRELALLRSLGAARGQIVSSVLVEALVTGVIGSALGVLVGFGLAQAIFLVLDRLGLGLPNAGLQFTASAVIAPLVIGTLITVVSAAVPAWRAGRVAPVQAMRSGLSSEGAGRSTLVAGVVGAVGIAAGVALAVVGSQQDVARTGAILVGCGALLLVVGAFLVMPALSPLIGGGIGRVIGAPFGAVGRLAATNAGRNSWRTAATAFSLTLGLALVSTFGTFGSSFKSSIDEAYSNGVASDVVVSGMQSTGGAPPGMPMDTFDKLERVDGAAAVTGIGFGLGLVDGTPGQIYGLYGPMGSATDAHAVVGDLEPHPDSGVVSESMAKDRGWHVGDTLHVVNATGIPADVPITGIYSDTATIQGLIVGPVAFAKIVPENMRTMQMVFLDAADGTSPDELAARAADVVADNPVIAAHTMKEQIKQASGMVDQLLSMIYALLALALVIAVLGIVNTLALSVIERKKELGMLRAIGTQRAQVRRTIMLESTQIAIFGALIGAGVGSFLGWAFVSALESQGISTVTIPWGTIAVVLAASAVVGVLASLWPAFRAARTSPLEAIAEG